MTAEVQDPSPHESVAEEVRALLGRRRLSGRKVALDLGWSKFYIGRRLNGQTPFDANDLAVLAAYLDVEVAVFFEGLDRDAVLSRSVSGTSYNSRSRKPMQRSRWPEAA